LEKGTPKTNGQNQWQKINGKKTMAKNNGKTCVKYGQNIIYCQ
jgi:hypothetical protein